MFLLAPMTYIPLAAPRGGATVGSAYPGWAGLINLNGGATCKVHGLLSVAPSHFIELSQQLTAARDDPFTQSFVGEFPEDTY